MDRQMLDDVLVFIGLMAVLFSITRVLFHAIGRRKALPDAQTATALSEVAQRLARLEQAVDTTALEVERMAEGQRFTAKLLADRE